MATALSAPAPLRERVSLDGVWDFRLDREETWRAIQVPGVWQAQFDDLRETQGVTWYRRNFTVPRKWHGDAGRGRSRLRRGQLSCGGLCQWAPGDGARGRLSFVRGNARP